MIEKKDWENLRKKLGDFDEKRENIIKDSAKVIKTSKLLIYALQRGEFKEAEKLESQIKEELEKMKSRIPGNSELEYLPAYKTAVQEYVEAISFLIFVKEKRLVAREELSVDAESYLMGVIDLTGELVRKAVNFAISREYRAVLDIKELVSEIYKELLKFNFRNSPLRKKFDSVKYNLKKLEDLVYDLKTKGLV